MVRAFTHRSFLNETPDDGRQSNERLEFLGDAVLELIVSDELYHQFPDKEEGEMTSLRAALVRTQTLAQVATTLGLGDRLQMSRGEAAGGGRTNPSLLADTFEAVIGALYLEKGLSAATQFVKDNLLIELATILSNNLHRDYKSSFQEKVQSQGHPTPHYDVISAEGPDHQKTFTVALCVGEQKISEGTGPSKQLAQQAAAKIGLERLEEGLKL